MANTYINVYTNNPTAGAADGTQLSTDGAQTSPLSVTLNATSAESKICKCAVRCDSGYSATGCTIKFTGTTAAKWTIAVDNSYADATAAAAATYSSSISLASVSATNTVFWIKAASSTDETPQKDISVEIEVTATVAAA